MDGRISNPAQLASLRSFTGRGGHEDGLRVIEGDNGVLRFLLNESKALDIMQMYHRGVNLSFLSKNGFTARELPFSRRFEGGMLYTCGLDSVGDRAGFELHGSLHGQAAHLLGSICDEQGITVTAEIADSELFGKNLRLRREISTGIGSETIRIRDRLSNLGSRAENYCLLYHINLGYPMLDEGVTIESEAAEVLPRTEHAARHTASRTVMGPCMDGEPERCYFIRQKKPVVTVRNERLNRLFRLEYSGDTLPCFVQWNSPASQDYALGLEPATTFLDERFAYRTLDAGHSVDFTLQMTVTQLTSN